MKQLIDTSIICCHNSNRLSVIWVYYIVHAREFFSGTANVRDWHALTTKNRGHHMLFATIACYE